MLACIILKMEQCAKSTYRVKQLDFQMLTIGHPARDLWYFLQMSTDPGFRSKHLETVFGNSVMFIALNPEPQSIDTWSSFKKLQRDVTEKIGGAEKETDHPLMKEIRRRITEGILELDALGLFH